MDPIGFSLENFDAIGVWRTNDNGFRVDPSGEMFDGTKLDGIINRYFKSTADAVAALQAGEIQFSYVEPDDLKNFAERRIRALR